MAPAGFADPSSIVQEDSFDGADLVIQSITIDDSGPVRIRFDLDGQGFPGWQAQYSDEGSPFEPGGGATLQVVLRGVRADGVVPADLPTSELVEVRTGQSDDGDLVVFLGMEEAPVPFRIQLQHSPLRLEVDLSSEG